MIKYICILALLLSGCAGLKKTETSGMTAGITTSVFSSIWKIMPGYKRKRIIWLEFKVEEAQLQLRREELRFETKDARLKYGKLSTKKKEEK